MGASSEAKQCEQAINDVARLLGLEEMLEVPPLAMARSSDDWSEVLQKFKADMGKIMADLGEGIKNIKKIQVATVSSVAAAVRESQEKHEVSTWALQYAYTEQDTSQAEEEVARSAFDSAVLEFDAIVSVRNARQNKLVTFQEGALKAFHKLQEELQANLETAKFKHDGTYYAQDVDGYSRIRVVRPGDVKTAKLDYDLLLAVRNCLGDGRIDVQEVQTVILPKVADGRLGRSELTCNERWTLRFAMGEFQWDFEARRLLLNEVARMDVLDTAGVKLDSKEAIASSLFGPSLEELQDPHECTSTADQDPHESSTKRLKTSENKLIYVDGMKLDREMLLAAKIATQGDGVIDACEAVKLFKAAADSDNVLTRCERWTFRFILASNLFTDAAFAFLKEALAKLAQNESSCFESIGEM